MKRLALIAVVISACATSQPSDPPATNQPRLAPWSAARLSHNTVSAVYHTEWSKAANRGTCALVAFANTGAGSGATARAATFSGGWAVAYDQAELRSAFGIAGSGSNASDQTYEWPQRIEWSDGSHATYGPEGGTGPNELAYLRISGQGCLYNVWSRLGRAHLEQLLNNIRYVDH
jgi:hypothetical protein